jgi:hypothetical protein
MPDVELSTPRQVSKSSRRAEEKLKAGPLIIVSDLS